MRVLEVSLRKAGFTVTAATSVQDALDKLEIHTPDLIISEATFTDSDGFELPRRVRATPDWADIPFIFLTAEGSIENKIRGLELGVDDYLTKPIYIKEIVTRINILLQKRQRLRFEERKDGHTRFAGRVADMPVVDVIQTIEISRKSGVIQFTGERGRQATIYFRDGRMIDAEAGSLQGEDAIYRLLTWSEGDFEVVFRTVRRREVITTSSQGLLMEGMRRLDEWSRLLEQLPPLSHRFEVDAAELAQRLGDVPDDNNNILRLIDGKRTLTEVIDGSDVGDLECLQAISRLYFEELLLDLDHGQTVRRDPGKPLPLVALEPATPFEDVVSGPIPLGALIDAVEAEVVAAAPEPPGSEPEVPGPLMGGYRPSSLRLIDEAVAAAQAIEPSLFDEDDPPRGGGARPMPEDRDAPTASAAPVVGNQNGISIAPVSVFDADDDDSIPNSIESEEPWPPVAPPASASRPAAPRAAPAASPALTRDDSGLRMIGSLGRDRAEASGELAPVGSAQPQLSATQRELVTILPRRSTREVALLPADVTPQVTAKDSARTSPPPPPRRDKPTTSPPLTGAVAPTSPKLPPLPARPIDPPSDSSLARRYGEGTGVFRQRTGPGAGPIALFTLAALLAGVAVVVWVSKADKRDDLAAVPALSADAATLPDEPPPDAGVAAVATDAMVAPADATLVVGADASVARDAGAAAAPDAEAPLDRNQQARELMDQATNALKEGNFEAALAHIDASIKLRRTARAYMVRAQALQRLDRIDAALEAVDLAAEVSPTYAPVFDLRGRILWAVGRKDEARFAFEQFLALDATSARADAVRALLRERP
ncbi:MAG: DUF4388 domain-containing protein [Myxococcota bacterium]|nr:DUF4388 domain-containing protein [Myxococcota bacterium]